MDFIRVPIDEITIGPRFRKDLGDLSGLLESIRERGLLQPIVLTHDWTLIAGARRLQVCRDLEWDSIPAVVINLDDLILGEHDENEMRKQFTLSERVAIAEAIKDRIGNRQGQRTDLRPEQLRKKIREVADADAQPGDRTDQVASKTANIGNETTFRQAKKVVEKGTESLRQAMDDGKVAPSTAAKVAELPAAQQEEVVKKVRKGTKAKVAMEEVQTTAPPTQEESQAVLDQFQGTATVPSSNGVVIQDAVGMTVPEHLQETWANLAQFDAVKKYLRDGQKLVAELAQLSGGEAYRGNLQHKASTRKGEDGQQVEKITTYCDHIHNAITKLDYNRPHASACPYCAMKGQDDACRACHGLAWVTKSVWENAPPDYQEGTILARKHGEA